MLGAPGEKTLHRASRSHTVARVESPQATTESATSSVSRNPNEQRWTCKECGEQYPTTQTVCINCSSGGRFPAPNNSCPRGLREEVDEDLKLCRLLKRSVELGYPIRGTLGDPHRGLLLDMLPDLIEGKNPWIERARRNRAKT